MSEVTTIGLDIAKNVFQAHGADILRQRVSRMRGFRQWRWHFDQMYVKLNGEMIYLWRAVDQEGEILESFVTMKRAKEADFSRGELLCCVFTMNP